MSYFLILLLLTSPQVTTGNLITKSMIPPKMVPIYVSIDFGPAGRPAIAKEVIVPEGATPKQALKKICAVQEGAACCHAEEVKGINGVSVNPLENRWWRLQINGTSKNVSPYKSHLKTGDRMAWIYFEDKQ
jgi:hypothetical protein